MATTIKRLTYDDAVFERVGNGYQSAPTTEDGAIQSRVLPELRLTLEAVFEGV
jgi:hypothetical protein